MLTQKDEGKVTALLSTFKCTREEDSEKFLLKNAWRHESKSISRTYLKVDTDENKVLGYFTLAMKCLSVEVSELDQSLSEPMNINNGIAQAYLIGQLAKADGAGSGFGKRMMDDALRTIREGKRMFGCNLVRLDCKDELIKYYESCGFTLIGKNKTKTLNQMVIFV